MKAKTYGCIGFCILLAGCDKPESPNLLLVTLDTTRADHIGAYGHPESKTPNIDALAAEGVVFEQAMSAIPITLPSHSTIMTGRYPPRHGVRDNGLFKLVDEQETLAEVLKRAGYATGAAIASFPLTSKFGIDQGFDYFDDRVAVNFEDHKGERVKDRKALFFDERTAQQVNAAILPWIRDHKDQPFFAWLHYFDPHRPWTAPAPFSGSFPNNGYLAEIAYADYALGQILEELKKMDALDNTLIVITSDHGEGLGQHREETHSLLNYNSTLHVPLIIKLPGETEAIRVAETVGTVDIAATILAALGLESQPSMTVDGRNLLEILHGDLHPSLEPTEYYAETLSPRLSHGWGEIRSLISGDYKYIHGPRPELYQYVSDPLELKNRIDEAPEQAQKMRENLSRWLQDFTANQSSTIDVDADTMQRLQALGYVSGRADLASNIEEQLTMDGDAPQDRVVDNGLFSTAKDMIFKEKYGLALSLTDELRRRDPDDWVYMDLQLRALLASGDSESALNLLLAERSKDRLQLDHAMTMARLYAAKGRFEHAVSVILESQPESPSANTQFFLAVMYERLGKPDMAGGALLAALQADPDFSEATISLAIRYARNGQHEKAESLLNETLAKHPFNIRALFNLGALYSEQEKLGQAREMFQRCLAIDANYSRAQTALDVLDSKTSGQ